MAWRILPAPWQVVQVTGLVPFLAPEPSQVSQVAVYGTVHVEIVCGHVVHHHDHADDVVVVPRDVPVATTTGVEQIGADRHEVTIYRSVDVLSP